MNERALQQVIFRGVYNALLAAVGTYVALAMLVLWLWPPSDGQYAEVQGDPRRNG